MDVKACCERADFVTAIDRHYADDAVSVEPGDANGRPVEICGIDAIRTKNEWFAASFEVHSVRCDGPFVAEGGFTLHLTVDATNRDTGERSTLSEMARYTVVGCTIVREEFFHVDG